MQTYKDAMSANDIAYAIEQNACNIMVSLPSSISTSDCMRYHATMIRVVQSSGIHVSYHSPLVGCYGRIHSLKGLIALCHNSRYVVSVVVSPTYHGIFGEKDVAVQTGSTRFEKIISGTIRGVKNPRFHEVRSGKTEIPVPHNESFPLCPEGIVFTWNSGKDGSGWYLRPNKKA